MVLQFLTEAFLAFRVARVVARLEEKRREIADDYDIVQDHDKDENKNTRDGYSRDEGDNMLKKSLLSSVVSESPNVAWQDVAGLQAAKEEIVEAVVFPLKFPALFTGKRKPWCGILLYGPPGTGKSHLARAIATEVKSTLISISSSDVQSKWVGESERLVRILFQIAREKKPSIIFIDEIDALCSSRESNHSSEHDNRLKTEIQVQMDGVGHDNTGVLVLAATNLPWALDPAVRRRFQKKICIPLPDKEARARLLQICVGNTPCGLTLGQYQELAEKTEGFSGSDISILVQDALRVPIKSLHTPSYYRTVYHEGKVKLTACSSNNPNARFMNWQEMPDNGLLPPKVRAEDFYRALSKAKSSVSTKELQCYQEWTEEFGMEGA